MKYAKVTIKGRRFKVREDGVVWFRKKGKWVRVTPIPTGESRKYLQVRGVRVHHIVMIGFNGPRPDGMVICHFPNQDGTDNRLCNLMWGTVGDNSLHRELKRWMDKIRNKDYGNKRGGKITEENIRCVRKVYDSGRLSLLEISGLTGIAEGLVRDIVYRRIWKQFG
jgi:hypothetical protein